MSNTMNVLFVSNDPSLSLSESNARVRMLEYSRAIGTLHIVTAGKKRETIVDGQLTIHVIPCNRFTRVSSLSRKAHAIILEHTISVVSAQDPFEHGLAALKAIAGTKAKLHVQIHTDFLSPWFVRGVNLRAPKVPVPVLNRARRSIADTVLPKAAGIRVVSERIRASLIEKYGTAIPDPVVIPIHIQADLPEPVRLPVHPFTFALITVGRLEPEKRIQDSITALARIRDEYPAVGLIVVGAGSELSKLRKLAYSKGLAKRVVFTDGWRTDAWGLMRNAQAYIQTSAYEGYSRTLVEAALAEIPIITTDVGIVGEVFKGYRDVLSTPVADPAALAVHIRELVENVALRTELTMHARDSVNAHLAATASGAEGIAKDLARLL
jgi:glycosyltransferase involved in cell wall biosynthesis